MEKSIHQFSADKSKVKKWVKYTAVLLPVLAILWLLAFSMIADSEMIESRLCLQGVSAACYETSHGNRTFSVSHHVFPPHRSVRINAGGTLQTALDLNEFKRCGVDTETLDKWIAMGESLPFEVLGSSPCGSIVGVVDTGRAQSNSHAQRLILDFEIDQSRIIKEESEELRFRVGTGDNEREFTWTFSRVRYLSVTSGSARILEIPLEDGSVE